ncbi:hypothetical protein [Phenylobacterium soli]
MDMADRHREALQELTRMGLELARDLHEAALSAATLEDKDRAAAAFHRISRSVRQSMALESRFEREAQRKAIEAERAASAARVTTLVHRQAEAVSAIERLVWTEYEGAEPESLFTEIGERLEHDDYQQALLTQPTDLIVRRLAEEFGIPVPPLRGRWPEGPEGVEAHELPNQTHPPP